MTEWDAVVVGAGPAGSALATRLASRGWRILLLDRMLFPRSKPCGESINPGAVREFTDLEALSAILELPHRRIAGWRIHPRSGRSFEGRYPEGACGLAVERAALDALLLERARDAGADFRREHVVDLIRRGGRVEGVRTAVGEEIRAPLVVGADGLRSVVVRRLGFLRRPPRLRKIALTAHAAGVELSDGIGELHLRAGGCIGVAAIAEDRANVVLVMASPAPEIGGDASGHFDRQMRTIPALARARRCSPVRATGPFDCPTRRIVGEGVLLIGDAAGYFDPFTGQGIFRALRSARLAAEAVELSLEHPEDSDAALRNYERHYRREMRPGRLLQEVIERVTSRPAPMAGVGALLRLSPALASRLVAAAGDLLPPHQLLSPRGFTPR